MKAGAKGQERGQKRTKEDKIEANTPQASKPPNSTRAQKPHNQRKTPNPHKHTSAPQNALKTPLKREIEPCSQATRQAQCRKADKRHGTHHQRTRANTEHSKSRHTYTSGHHHQRSTRHDTHTPHFKNMFRFRPFRSPRFPRKHQSTPKNYSFLTYFDLIRCPFDLVEWWRTPEAGANESRLDI